MKVVESVRCFGGTQQVVQHESAVLGCTMRFGLYLPPGLSHQTPVLTYLSGLTCTEQNVITKSGIQRHLAEHGLIGLFPDTSPRGAAVADSKDWDLGQGAGFYVTATQEPWAAHYRMDQYILQELPGLLKDHTRSEKRGVTGHSMGGHGALVLALRNPGHFQSASALAPILEPSRVPWGQKAFAAYLGEDEARWAEWDAERLIPGASERLPLLIDQGDADVFLGLQLGSENFLRAASAANHEVRYRLHSGYDHSYYFVASFIDQHVLWHAHQLGLA